jgi:DNA-binding NtrC family response regulator
MRSMETLGAIPRVSDSDRRLLSEPNLAGACAGDGNPGAKSRATVRKKLLWVDDDVDLTELLCMRFELEGEFEVRVANQAEDAMPIAREYKPDVVILDVRMPRMFGGDIAARLQAEAGFEQTPFLFHSGTVKHERVAEHDGVIGGFPFLAKPATYEQLRAFIRSHLNAGSPKR